jgi:LacI family transcriptional regulator
MKRVINKSTSRSPGGTARASSRVASARTAASIQDVAAEAAVSIATVSRVLNNPNLVSEGTATKVRAAIDKLGYRPNAFAQGLMTRTSRVLGIALPDIHGEFYSQLLLGADAEARKSGYHLLVSSDARAGDMPGPNLAFGLLDGLAIMLTEPNPQILKEANAAGVPLVLVDGDPSAGAHDVILVDNESGARDATAHLLSRCQPSHCYFVGGPKENFDTASRAKGFAAVLSESGSKPKPAQMAFGQYSFEWGRGWAAGMIGRGLLRGAGVLAGNDDIAYGVIHAAREAGLVVPDDLLVIGFDDTRLASLIQPTLTTVRIPLPEVGAAAVRALINRIESPDAPAESLMLKPSLIVRESTSPREWRHGK